MPRYAPVTLLLINKYDAHSANRVARGLGFLLGLSMYLMLSEKEPVIRTCFWFLPLFTLLNSWLGA